MDRRTFLAAAGTTGLASLLGTGLGAAQDAEFTREEYLVESFDGVEIPTVLFVPDGGADATIMATHGWGGSKSSVEGYASLAANNGYALIVWDQRGFGESTAEVGLSGPKEVADVSALIDLVAADERIVDGSDGEPLIGMIGASYGGGIQLNAAAVDDRIDALVPVVPWHDLSFSLEPNGVPKLGWVSLLYGAGIEASRGLSNPDQENLRRGVSPRLHELYTETLARNQLPPEGEAFLSVRSTVAKADRIDTPSLVVQGLPDTLFTPNEGDRIVEALRSDGGDARLVLFNGGHTATETAAPEEQVAEIERMAIAWFDQHLRDDGDADIAPLTYWDIQQERFRTADDFPPRRATTVEPTLADLAGDGNTDIVNTAAPTSTSQLAPENGDHAPVSHAAFDLAIEEDVEVLGIPELSLSVTPLAARAFLFGKVYHIRDGTDTLINNQVAPVAIEGTPGTTQQVEWELVGFQRHFAAGDTLRLVLASTDAGFTSARQGAGVRVHHADSTLSLPVLGPESGRRGGAEAADGRGGRAGGERGREDAGSGQSPSTVTEARNSGSSLTSR